MSRASLISREYRCLRCCGDPSASMKHFRVRFWTASTFRGAPLTPSFRDLRCPDCGANPAWFEPWPRMCANFIMPLRDDLRPVVFRKVDERGREHIRYPSTNSADARPGEERIDFPTLRSMSTFLKEQNPNHRQWQVPLNDILDYDEARINDPAMDTTDPGAVEDAEAVMGTDDFGVLDAPPDPSEVKMTLVK